MALVAQTLEQHSLTVDEAVALLAEEEASANSTRAERLRPSTLHVGELEIRTKPKYVELSTLHEFEYFFCMGINNPYSACFLSFRIIDHLGYNGIGSDN